MTHVVRAGCWLNGTHYKSKGTANCGVAVYRSGTLPRNVVLIFFSSLWIEFKG